MIIKATHFLLIDMIGCFPPVSTIITESRAPVLQDAVIDQSESNFQQNCVTRLFLMSNIVCVVTAHSQGCYI